MARCFVHHADPPDKGKIMVSRRKPLTGIAGGLVVAGGAGYYLARPKPVEISLTLKPETLDAAQA